MANVTADQASGAGSMAGPILRTGHLSLLARAANLYFRGERWFHGAFLDARKQDALDLVSGAYQVGHSSVFNSLWRRERGTAGRVRGTFVKVGQGTGTCWRLVSRCPRPRG